MTSLDLISSDGMHVTAKIFAENKRKFIIFLDNSCLQDSVAFLKKKLDCIKKENELKHLLIENCPFAMQVKSNESEIKNLACKSVDRGKLFEKFQKDAIVDQRHYKIYKKTKDDLEFAFALDQTELMKLKTEITLCRQSIKDLVKSEARPAFILNKDKKVVTENLAAAKDKKCVEIVTQQSEQFLHSTKTQISRIKSEKGFYCLISIPYLQETIIIIQGSIDA